jgi:RNA polymerase sigma-70 factor (ECF subfamily)
MPISDPDIELMLAFQRGDEDALEQLVRKYEGLILNMAYRYTGERAQAEDLTQEVFLRVYQARKAYRPDCPFKHWIFRIVTNLCLNWVRDTKRARSVSLFAQADSPQVNIKDDQGRVSDYFRKLELKIAVKEAIDSLPATQRLALILNKYDECSYEEIARIMKMSVPAVKSLLYRARESLKEKLKRFVSTTE